MTTKLLYKPQMVHRIIKNLAHQESNKNYTKITRNIKTLHKFICNIKPLKNKL